MENNYSVEEILSAIDDLQKIKKEKKIISVKNTSKTDNLIIPKHTLKQSKKQYQMPKSL